MTLKGLEDPCLQRLTARLQTVTSFPWCKPMIPVARNFDIRVSPSFMTPGRLRDLMRHCASTLQ